VLAYLNGQFLPRADAAVPVEDRGFVFADGVYEGIRIYNGVPFALFDRDAAVPAVTRPVNFPLDAGVSIAAALVVLGFGIIPSPLIDLARTASSSLFG